MAYPMIEVRVCVPIRRFGVISDPARFAQRLVFVNGFLVQPSAIICIIVGSVLVRFRIDRIEGAEDTPRFVVYMDPLEVSEVSKLSGGFPEVPDETDLFQQGSARQDWEL